MTLVEKKQTVNAWLADLWPTLLELQQRHKDRTGKCFQGLMTHRNPVEDNDLPDGLDDHPTDQQASWRDRIPDAPFPCRMKCDVAQGPLGWAFTFYVRFRHNGKIYQRSKGVGPYSITESWHRV